ncbi:MAG TPA: hypothetical protein VIF57_10240, partial [Polyangia bacterium]
LPDDARARLAARLDAARAADGATDDVAGAGEDPGALVAAVDRARAARAAEPLIVGEISGDVARPVAGRADGGDGPALPPIDDGAGAATAEAERAALAGDAGAAVRALLKASGATRLRRVTGWPTGAAAVADTVYVNAAWLVALAPAGGDRPDAGAPLGSPANRAGIGARAGASAPVPAPVAATPGAAGEEASAQRSALASGSAAYYQPDGGTSSPPPPPPDPPPYDGTSCWDACGTCADACASSPPYDDGSSDSCDSGSSGDSCDSGGSGDSCDSTSDDGSGDSCDSTTADGSADSCSSTGDGSESGCQVARARSRCHGQRRRRGGTGTEAWLLAPLGYLMLGQKRRGP